MTIIALWSFDRGSGPMRSTEILCQALVGTSDGCSVVGGGLVLIRVFWQVGHPSTYVLMSLRIVGHQNVRKIFSCILCLPGCPASAVSWYSFNILSRILPFGTYTLSLQYRTPSSPSFHSPWNFFFNLLHSRFPLDCSSTSSMIVFSILLNGLSSICWKRCAGNTAISLLSSDPSS